MALSITHLNGSPATVSNLAPLAFAGYAHFTAMQMRNHSVRGMDLHVERLRNASDELFGRHLSDDQITEFLRIAVDDAGAADASLTCFITSHPGEFAPADDAPELDVLVKVTDPAQPPVGPLSLDVVRHERHLPQVKHVGEVGKTLFLRRANARGFDDAAFEDRVGRLSEATIWNLAFWDGESVIWPEADYLPGVTMQILARRLQSMAVRQQIREIRPTDMNDQFSAVVMNSWTPGIPVSRIGDKSMAQDATLSRLLDEAYTGEAQTRL
ncbi:aminotransferase class IV [Saxibacter everestensis]|uniref:Aminotransferase class IV n=1 Tax=Saxibacter everestensis TaxID=2909229 RepID=A0ABY8QTX8_9MICO|nr:aminotransferase class IV [Brevibacteriaceae bacterium ZFBP1038]